LESAPMTKRESGRRVGDGSHALCDPAMGCPPPIPATNTDDPMTQHTAGMDGAPAPLPDGRGTDWERN
ncbi:unnamed protein product, partial [marine sediment metagenome]